MTIFTQSIVWFRRDLRAEDHAALHLALRQSQRVFCVFIFDREILEHLPSDDRRVAFIHASLTELHAELQHLGSGLIVRHAVARQAIPDLARQLRAQAVFTNTDYEPQAVSRDADVAQKLAENDCAFFSVRDQVILEKNEVLTQAGTPFSVFTPYKNAWLKTLAADLGGALLAPHPVREHSASLAPAADLPHAGLPSLAALGFDAATPAVAAFRPGSSGGLALLEDFLPRMAQYHLRRDFPSLKGPSYLSAHLRFGTVSIRALVRRAWDAERSGQGGTGAAIWLSELIWREFYFMILHHAPHVAERAFKPAYDAIQWESGPLAQEHFEAWCQGRTGYPLVDAAMLQLNQTGYMHNRLRMVTACFLIKDLGIDWRWGERYFAEKLMDFDLAANNGGWQWAASSGCDAQPYFRIFNPVTQSQKFDADGSFIRRYLPQLEKLDKRHIHAPWLTPPDLLKAAGIVLGKHYPAPVIMHDEARKQTLARYGVVKQA
ncbi:deoxyribodipyrimidine photo-lyase [Janthinobacterium sp. 17J80-10]|uniref:cryptochrome/photolyase family protein n=1 Tax=Janthinobacterium sp. 17J80-10 TaxID=2497863 RepID=UPI0010058C1C|nr:deoxyribodipyrimidine photo-lyase [Janthinobacterium sp. 17J80-10]QAU33546.1 deoxyribodipyrimidine photo-lyase [Janthinobacterium sp. 17J80-10]